MGWRDRRHSQKECHGNSNHGKKGEQSQANNNENVKCPYMDKLASSKLGLFHRQHWTLKLCVRAKETPNNQE